MKIRVKTNWKVTYQQMGSFILFLAIVILSINYRDNMDYAVYYQDYMRQMGQGKITFGFEFLYSLISGLFAINNISFNVFYGCYIALEMLLVYVFFLSMCKKNTIFVMFLFLAFPYIQFLMQIRSALGATIILIAISKLQENTNKKEIIAFVIAVGIASLLQITNVVYALLLFPVIAKAKTVKKAVIGTFLFTLLFFRSIYSLLMRAINAIPALNRIRYNLHSDFYISKFSMMYVIFYFALFLLLIITWKMSNDRTDKNEFLYRISLMITGLSCLTYITEPAYRISCLLLPWIYVTLIQFIMKINTTTTKSIMMCVVALTSLLHLLFMWGPQNERMYYLLTNVCWKIGP